MTKSNSFCDLIEPAPQTLAFVLQQTNTDWIDVAALIVSSVAALATIAAVIAALYISNRQEKILHHQGFVKCRNHAMSVVNDLGGRVLYLRGTLEKGGEPLSALTINSEQISRRFEALYDREIYQYMPPSIIKTINSMSATFFSIEAQVANISASLNNNASQAIPNNLLTEKQSTTLVSLEIELSNLFEELNNLAKND